VTLEEYDFAPVGKSWHAQNDQSAKFRIWTLFISFSSPGPNSDTSLFTVQLPVPVYRNIDQIKLGPSSLRSTATLLRRRLNNNNSLGVNLSLRPYSVPFSSLRAPRYDHRRPLPLPYCTPTPPLSPHIQPTPNPVELPSEIPFPLPPHDRSNRPPAKPTPIPTRSLGNAVPRSRTRVRRLQGREMVG